MPKLLFIVANDPANVDLTQVELLVKAYAAMGQQLEVTVQSIKNCSLAFMRPDLFILDEQSGVHNRLIRQARQDKGLRVGKAGRTWPKPKRGW